ncbi:MAG: arginine decarboxylase [Aureispira sp.]
MELWYSLGCFIRMKKTYIDFIQERYDFPQKGLKLENNQLTFNGVDIQGLIKEHGTPLKLTYLPKISTQIQTAKDLFEQAFQSYNYQGQYYFCYCTKCNHLYPVVNKALEAGIHLETSSALDIELIKELEGKGKVTKEQTVLLHNGYKTAAYLQKIVALTKAGYQQSITILDNQQELHHLERYWTPQDAPMKIGLRMAVNQESTAPYRTSRLGIPAADILSFVKEALLDNPKVEFKMLHFFVDSGIKNTAYYWSEFQRALTLYITLQKEVPSLTDFNLGGGFPIANQLGFEYDYQGIVNKMVSTIQIACKNENVPVPNIFTEFGRYTVGESGAIIFEVLGQKKQNEEECWYLINNSLMNTIPDAWSIQEKFILLPINKWDQSYQSVTIGGISCDYADYYQEEYTKGGLHLPSYEEEKNETPLYLGFFHTGAYQDAISGYGGIKHCLIPAPKHLILDRDVEGNLVESVYGSEESTGDVFQLLGYT